MTTPAAPYIESAERLCSTLERIGDALVSLDTATLLETEDTLGRLVAVLASATGAADRATVEPLVERAHEALLRCRRLGASFTGTARTRLQLCTGAERYGPTGGLVEAHGPAATMRVTV